MYFFYCQSFPEFYCLVIPTPHLMVTAFLTNLLGCQRRAVCFQDSLFSNYLFSLLWRLTPHLLLEIVPLSSSSRIKYFSEPLLTWSHKRQITNCTTIGKDQKESGWTYTFWNFWVMMWTGSTWIIQFLSQAQTLTQMWPSDCRML